MALIKCPECGKEISDKAGKCPYCGYPIEEIESTVEKETDKEEVLDNNKETHKKKKTLNKKVIITISAIIGAAVIGAGAYMIKTADARMYKQAKQLYNEADYKSALEKFKKIEDYENSKELIEKCEYNLSPDGQFLITFVNGLEERWDYSKTDRSDLSEKEILEKSIHIELDKLDKLDNNFKDEKLATYYQSYCDVLNDGLNALSFITVDYNQYVVNWNEAYKERCVLIRDIFNEYNLEVDKKYQKTLDEFVNSASVVDSEKKLESQVEDMMGQFVISHETNEWGDIVYKITVSNTTEFTFDYFYADANIIDTNGTIIATTQVGQIESWEPGQQAVFDLYMSPEVKDPSLIASTTYTAHYQVGEYYK